MTKEELEKEANDYADEHAFRVPYDGSNKFYDDVDFKASKEGYLAGAEPREKRNAELTTNNKTLIKENGILRKENAKLKTDYEVLSCSVDDFGELQDKLEEEQRKNNELSDNLTKVKELLKWFVWYFREGSPNLVSYKHTVEEAEQFLLETDIDNAIQKANEGLDLDKIADEVEQDLNESCPDILCEDCTKEDCTVRKLGLVGK